MTQGKNVMTQAKNVMTQANNVLQELTQAEIAKHFEEDTLDILCWKKRYFQHVSLIYNENVIDFALLDTLDSAGHHLEPITWCRIQ